MWAADSRENSVASLIVKLSVDLTNHQFHSFCLICSRYMSSCFTCWSGFTYLLKWRKCRLQPTATDNGLASNEVVTAKDQILVMERLQESLGGAILCVPESQRTSPQELEGPACTRDADLGELTPACAEPQFSAQETHLESLARAIQSVG